MKMKTQKLRLIHYSHNPNLRLEEIDFQRKSRGAGRGLYASPPETTGEWANRLYAYEILVEGKVMDLRESDYLPKIYEEWKSEESSPGEAIDRVSSKQGIQIVIFNNEVAIIKESSAVKSFRKI